MHHIANLHTQKDLKTTKLFSTMLSRSGQSKGLLPPIIMDILPKDALMPKLLWIVTGQTDRMLPNDTTLQA